MVGIALPARDRLGEHVQDGTAAVVTERAIADLCIDGPAAALKSVRAGRPLAKWRARDIAEGKVIGVRTPLG